MIRTLVLSALIALGVAGCSADGVSSFAERGLIVTGGESSVRITNRTGEPVYIFAAGGSTLASINWGPCFGGPDCPALPVGATRSIPFSQIGLGECETAAIVFWWHRVPGPGVSFEADSIRSVPLSLPGRSCLR